MTTAGCAPAAVMGCVAAAALTWVLPLAVTAGAALVGLAAAVRMRDRRTRRRMWTAAGALVTACWAAAALVVLPLTTPRALLVSGVTGAALAAAVLTRTRRHIVEARAAWPPATSFAAQAPRWQRAVVRQVSDEQLCRMWDDSTKRLLLHHHSHHRSASTLRSLADLRRRLLDELERRSPAAFARWMERPDHAHMCRYLAGQPHTEDPGPSGCSPSR